MAHVRAVLYELNLLSWTLASRVLGKGLRFSLTLTPLRAGSEMEDCAQAQLTT